MEKIGTKMLQMDLEWSQTPEPRAWIIVQCPGPTSEWWSPTLPPWTDSPRLLDPTGKPGRCQSVSSPVRRAYVATEFKTTGERRQVRDWASGTARVEHGK
ncbi:unnamed protein product [Pleuronectes platessa]|uniref:Uncharacterized protein n=1 Tax=Pleuronectes platessa TaxID=8262 RepID=A0A9N7VYL7_PLEPL|nr:unnamed protein product [Pleuronectes platessa]